VPNFAVPSGQAVPDDRQLIDSGACTLPDLLEPPYAVSDLDRQPLDLGEGWTSRWGVSWKVSGHTVSALVRDIASVRVAGRGPVRPFTWRPDQSHRPGLAAMASTGRLHGFESLTEQRLLLALDFCGEVTSVLSQPFRLRFAARRGGAVLHVPDFLAVTRSGTWLIDVRPAELIGREDRVNFAASAELALTQGWQYLVAGGWKPHVQSVLDAFSAQRRALADPLGIRQELLRAAKAGALPFRALAGATSYPVIGRAHALHLLWHRELAASLAEPFGDKSLVWATGNAGSR